MNSLLQALIEQAYKAKIETNRIAIRLPWAVMPIFITRNIQKNMYELKLRYWCYVIVIVAFLINAFIGVNIGNSISAIGWGMASLVYLISAFWVHHKVKDLQKYINSINGTEYT